VIIRPETAADHDAIQKVHDEAFGSPIEAKLVAFRGGAIYPPETFGISL
jgi:predicted N-acetyltransferase YhbS